MSRLTNKCQPSQQAPPSSFRATQKYPRVDNKNGPERSPTGAVTLGEKRTKVRVASSPLYDANELVYIY